MKNFYCILLVLITGYIGSSNLHAASATLQNTITEVSEWEKKLTYFSNPTALVTDNPGKSAFIFGLGTTALFSSAKTYYNLVTSLIPKPAKKTTQKVALFGLLTAGIYLPLKLLSTVGKTATTEQLDATEKRLGKKIDTTTEEIMTKLNEFDNLKKQLKALQESTVKGFAVQLAATNELKKDFEKKTQVLETHLSDQDKKTDENHEETLKQFENQKQEFENGFKQQKEHLERLLTEKLTSFEQQIKKIEEQLKNLDKLNNIETDVAVIKKQAETITKELETTKEAFEDYKDLFPSKEKVTENFEKLSKSLNRIQTTLDEQNKKTEDTANWFKKIFEGNKAIEELFRENQVLHQMLSPLLKILATAFREKIDELAKKNAELKEQLKTRSQGQ